VDDELSKADNGKVEYRFVKIIELFDIYLCFFVVGFFRSL
jgi:hypothetical protein